VSCPPLYPRTENVARSPAVLPHLVSLAEHHTPGAGVIPLEDLAVSGDAHWLYLMSLSRRRPVEPTVFSAVEFINAAHPLLRFLCEISMACCAACAPFSWGAASQLPFLPRVRYRRTILSPQPGADHRWPPGCRPRASTAAGFGAELLHVHRTPRPRPVIGELLEPAHRAQAALDRVGGRLQLNC